MDCAAFTDDTPNGRSSAVIIEEQQGNLLNQLATLPAPAMHGNKAFIRVGHLFNQVIYHGSYVFISMFYGDDFVFLTNDLQGVLTREQGIDHSQENYNRYDEQEDAQRYDAKDEKAKYRPENDPLVFDGFFFRQWHLTVKPLLETR